MEKPMKREHSDPCKVKMFVNNYPHDVCTCGADSANEVIDAMSTWIEGEIPSKQDLRAIVVKALDIENLKADEEIMKNFPMTVLEICNGADEIVDNIHTLLTQRLGVVK